MSQPPQPHLYQLPNKRLVTAVGPTTSLFHPRSIATLLALTIQLSADDTLQLLDSAGHAISQAFTLKANTIWSVPPRVVTNIDRIVLSIAGGATCLCELAFLNGQFPELLCDQRNYFYFPGQDQADQTSHATDLHGQQAVGAASVAIVAQNLTAKERVIVNTGTTIIYLGLGFVPTVTAYSVALSPCAAANDGTGGTFVTDIWTGAINAIGSAAGGTVVATELI